MDGERLAVSGIRVRFAPSPTGHLHLGAAHTALFNWLYARKNNGTFVLRIEDADAGRSTKESYEAILGAMRWLGLDWDEGPVKGGPHRPYIQSARSVVYRNEAERLLDQRRAYRCFCSPGELEELRSEAIASGRPSKYDGRCLRLPEDEVELRVARGVPHVVRFRIEEGRTRFRDLIRGEFDIDNAELDDFVVLKSDGRPTSNFAVVVDDAKMGITHVIRGDEHLSNTPKQVLLYRALGYSIPRFAHLPIVLGSDRARLSKRNGATSIEEYRRLGVSPDALLNYLALLGWSFDGETEIFTREDLVEKFSLKRVNRRPAAFDEEKLKYINAQHFKRLDPIEKLGLVHDKLVEAGVLPGHKDELPRLGFILNVMGNRLAGAADAPDALRYLFKDDYPRDIAAYEKHLGSEAPDRLSRLAARIEVVEPFCHDQIESAVRGLAAEMGIAAADLIHPARVALTGRAVSPDIFAVMQLLGRAKCAERLRAPSAEGAAPDAGAAAR